MSLRFHFDFTSISLRCHFDFISISLLFHFDFTSISLPSGKGNITTQGKGKPPRGDKGKGKTPGQTLSPRFHYPNKPRVRTHERNETTSRFGPLTLSLPQPPLYIYIYIFILGGLASVGGIVHWVHVYFRTSVAFGLGDPPRSMG